MEINKKDSTYRICTLQFSGPLTTNVLRHNVPAGARGSNAAARSHTLILLNNNFTIQ